MGVKLKLTFAVLLVFSVLQILISYDKSRGLQRKLFVSPIKSMTLFTFGYNSMISSLFWIRLIQDVEVCDQSEEKQELPGLKEKDVLSEVLGRKLPEAKCSQGWVYKMLDVITDLSPDFHRAYLDGATLLSVLVDDRLGAQKLFAKGIVDYPDDWEILYRAAYHELFEMQNPKEAARLLKLAGEMGAPGWVYALAAKIYSKLGQAIFAKTILESVLERKSKGPAMERVREQLKRINETIGKNSQ